MEPFTQQPSSLPNQPESGHSGQVHTTQGMLQQTPVQQAKTFISTNIKKPWGIAVVILASLLVLGIIINIGSIISAQDQSSPTATLQKYCDGEVHQNASEVSSTMDSPGQTEAAIQEQFNGMQSAGESITSCVVSKVQQNGSTVYGTVTETISLGGNTEQVSPTVLMKLENGQWKIYGQF